MVKLKTLGAAVGKVYMAGFGFAAYSAGSVKTMIRILGTALRVDSLSMMQNGQ